MTNQRCENTEQTELCWYFHLVFLLNWLDGRCTKTVIYQHAFVYGYGFGLVLVSKIQTIYMIKKNMARNSHWYCNKWGHVFVDFWKLYASAQKFWFHNKGKPDSELHPIKAVSEIVLIILRKKYFRSQRSGWEELILHLILAKRPRRYEERGRRKGTSKQFRSDCTFCPKTFLFSKNRARVAHILCIFIQIQQKWKRVCSSVEFLVCEPAVFTPFVFCWLWFALSTQTEQWRKILTAPFPASSFSLTL